MECLLYVGLVCGQLLIAAPTATRYEFSQTQMGVSFTIVLYAPDETAANRAAEAAFRRVAQLNAVYSDYDAQSELMRLCRQAEPGRAVPVSDDLFHVLARSQALAERTDGAFDITVGPYVRLWRRARRQRQLPSVDRLADAKAAVGYRHLKLHCDERSVELLRPGMRLDLGGIAKGHAADEALRVLEKHGIRQALVDASGDIVAGEPPPGQPGWRIGIAPLDVDAPPSRYVLLARGAVATSGDAWQHVEIDGTRYSHIVDPRTGIGLTESSSVTVVAPDGLTADSLATAVSVLGPDEGLRLIDEMPETAALVVRSIDGQAKAIESARFSELHFVAPAE